MATIFIVDDEPVLHELYSSVLEIGGHEIVANAHDGDEAVEIFKGMNEHPDVIIMDHRMPNKNGIDATKEILEIKPDMNILFASADLNVEGDALESGARSFLSKPFAIADLLAMVEEMVGE